VRTCDVTYCGAVVAEAEAVGEAETVGSDAAEASACVAALPVTRGEAAAAVWPAACWWEHEASVHAVLWWPGVDSLGERRGCTPPPPSTA
jgi:hypothetical protein